MTSTENKDRATSSKSTKLPMRKRKIEKYLDADEVADHMNNVSEPVSLSSYKRSKNVAILDAALSLADLGDSKAKPRLKQQLEKFPETLMKILSSDKHSDSVCWVKDANLFFFVDSNKFTEEVLPLYFKRTKFSSFTRRLSRWGFRQVKGGPHSGCFYHSLFRRESKELCMKIKPPSSVASEIAASSHFSYASDKPTTIFLNFKGLDSSMDQRLSHNIPSLNDPVSDSHRSSLSEIPNISRFGPISSVVDQRNRVYGHFDNPNARQKHLNDKMCNIKNVYDEYLNTLQNRNRMIRNLISKPPPREDYAKSRAFLMAKELLRAKLKAGSGSVPYFLGSEQQMSNLTHSNVLPMKPQKQFPYEQISHPNKLEHVLGGVSSQNSNNTHITPQTDSAEVIRRAVQILYNS